MFSLYDQLPKYLLGKYQLTSTVVFTALFSLVLLLVSLPYAGFAWFQLGAGNATAYTLSFFILAATAVAVSKRFMYLSRNVPITCLQYICWNACEAIFISLLYVLFTYEGIRYGILQNASPDYEKIFFGALLFSVAALGVPYLICAMYFAIQDKNNTIRLMNFQEVVSDVELQPFEEKRITLFDNNGVLKFAINSGSLYFIESDDNYIQVWYTDSSGKLKQYMLRCRLKTVEDSFADSDLVRCHRKYIINITKVRVLTAEKDGYYLDLDLDSVDPIPISKTYEQAVLARFNSR